MKEKSKKNDTKNRELNKKYKKRKRVEVSPGIIELGWK